MALITRVSRLFQADLHAVLDRIEEPDVLLNQAVREMEEELARDEQRLKLIKHEQNQYTTRADEVKHLIIETETEMDVCFESGKEDLAKTLIRRKLEMYRLMKEMSRKAEDMKEKIIGLEADLKENRMRLDSMKQKAELLIDVHKPGAQSFGVMVSSSVVSDEDVEVAYLREKQKRDAS